MGDWSDHFEDFPEENPDNYEKRGRYERDAKLVSQIEGCVQQVPTDHTLYHRDARGLIPVRRGTLDATRIANTTAMPAELRPYRRLTLESHSE